MTDRLPYPLPGQWDPSGPYRNPGNTNPLPSPGNMPTPCWFGARNQMAWGNSALSKVQSEAFWSSPIFDMRPDMRSMTHGTGNGQRQGGGTNRTIMGGVPIWTPAAQLWVQLDANHADGLRGLDLRGFQILATEEAHISDPSRLASISGAQDVTEEFSTLGNSALLGWMPYGSGLPVRYYRLRLTFHIRDNFANGALPPICAQGAMY